MSKNLEHEQIKPIKPSLVIERLVWVFSLLFTASFLIFPLKFPDESKELRSVLLICLSAVSFIGLLCSLTEGLDKKFGYHKVKDLRRAVLSTLIIFQFLLIYIRIFHEELIKEFVLPEVRWFVMLMSTIAVIGAIWAILARIDAGRAFESAEKIRKSISTSLHFEKLVKKDLVATLKEPFDEMTLVLGIPAVGYFEKDIRSAALSICNHLANVLKDLDEKDKAKKITLLFFSNDKIAEYIISSYVKKELSFKEIEAFDDDLQNLCNSIKRAKDVLGANLMCYRYEIETGLRFITLKSKKLGEYIEKAVIWVVTDFEHENPGEFKAAGFITQDETIVDQFSHLGKDYCTQLHGIECNHTNSFSILQLVSNKLQSKYELETDINKKGYLQDIQKTFLDDLKKYKSSIINIHPNGEQSKSSVGINPNGKKLENGQEKKDDAIKLEDRK